MKNVTIYTDGACSRQSWTRMSVCKRIKRSCIKSYHNIFSYNSFIADVAKKSHLLLNSLSLCPFTFINLTLCLVVKLYSCSQEENIYNVEVVLYTTLTINEAKKHNANMFPKFTIFYWIFWGCFPIIFLPIINPPLIKSIYHICTIKAPPKILL